MTVVWPLKHYLLVLNVCCIRCISQFFFFFAQFYKHFKIPLPRQLFVGINQHGSSLIPCWKNFHVKPRDLVQRSIGFSSFVAVAFKNHFRCMWNKQVKSIKFPFLFVFLWRFVCYKTNKSERKCEQTTKNDLSQ